MSKGRKVAATYLPPNLRDLLQFLCLRLQLSESEVLRLCLMEYADAHNLLTQYLHKGKLEAI